MTSVPSEESDQPTHPCWCDQTAYLTFENNKLQILNGVRTAKNQSTPYGENCYYLINQDKI